jgi:hypothetical protein
VKIFTENAARFSITNKNHGYLKMAAPKLNLGAIRPKTPRLELIEGELGSKDDAKTETGYFEPLEVCDYESKTAPVTDDGLAITSLMLHLNNRSIYKATITEPTDGDVAFNRIVGKSPAWVTDEKDPFNIDWSEKLAFSGSTVLDLSHEHVLHRDPRETARRFCASSVLNDAHALLAALRLVQNEQLASNAGSNEIIGTGLSKSCITSMLMVGRTSDYGLKIPYIDGIDPSGEHPWGIGDLKDLSRIGIGTLVELKEVAEILAENSIAKLPEVLRRHLLMSPRSTLGHLAAAKSLVLSEAGKYFLTPNEDSIMHITCFEGSWFNQHSGWMERLGGLANVHVNPERGGHLKGGRELVRQASVERIAKVQALLAGGIAPTDIDPARQISRQKTAVEANFL